ncbi:MAG: sigma-54 dependent transcriptional regulator [Methylococcaceae bacterium]|jgi:DNA-binding NtrC family response regulator|nr:sigma-54 dependent transcriptional regulator [Methylococcaceae bacterium]MDZ4157638.1 sigma-54 dependent transcriptional regulator [Methylococcales bacterium]MDP2393110.1 sigma-54 dependent transcriptional regulator [Methylococcaceae bacterium]MDP3019254.1 sigma-54 dependent transcriptional regulator [Methylococcaceae bacterium]MDP3389165.1 sigma-54 dependent transcriptional regulator [Methylococcaceae bacterium]
MAYFRSIIGQSPALDSLIRSARIVATTDVTVLLKGETGTGKEVFAKAIQKSSARSDKPFITVNCAALPEGLIESELFGHKKGAFTGASSSTQGLLQAADGGTLFLDEINSLPLGVQAKFLRFLDSGECLVVGETKPIKVNVRVIAATNSDLTKQIGQGDFRQDLYFRLNVVPLELPPLSQRTEDIEPLAVHFLNLFAKAHSIDVPKLSKATLKVLKQYKWPGNIRELRNLCERLSVLLAGKVIEPENLPAEFSVTVTGQLPEGGDFILPAEGVQLDSLEADLISQALQRTNGNRAKTAKLLGISRDTLLYRMQKHGFSISH